MVSVSVLQINRTLTDLGVTRRGKVSVDRGSG